MPASAGPSKETQIASVPPLTHALAPRLSTMRAPAAPMTAPSEKASSAYPTWASDIWRLSLSAGRRGTQLPLTAPKARKAMDTARRSRFTSRRKTAAAT